MTLLVCKTSWCICLAAPDGAYCAVHRKDHEVRPLLPQYAVDKPIAKRDDCADCGGTGECAECDGDGTHVCGHRNCLDEHDCGECDGTGKCQTCHDDNTREPAKSPDALYLEWVAEGAWSPWQPANPWDEATA